MFDRINKTGKDLKKYAMRGVVIKLADRLTDTTSPTLL